MMTNVQAADGRAVQDADSRAEASRAARVEDGRAEQAEKSRAGQAQNSRAGRAEDARAVLAAPGRSPEIPESADVYGWLIGSWDLEVLHYGGVDVAARGLEGEAHFGWALEGRAVQDAWIMPRRSARTVRGADTEGASTRVGAGDKGFDMYGTTLRVWDAAIQAWRITWINPVSGHREEQIGRRIGPDIVQIGARANGTPTRWRFTGITPDSFHWIGEALNPDGQTWTLEGEFRARRVPA